MEKKYTLEETMASFKLRASATQRTLRRIAAWRLIYGGCTEVGTSDVNHELCAMCNEFQGDWDEAYFWAVENTELFD